MSTLWYTKPAVAAAETLRVRIANGGCRRMKGNLRNLQSVFLMAQAREAARSAE